MSQTLTNLLPSSQSMGADIATVPAFIGDSEGFSLQAVYTGTPTGTFRLQVSNDLGPYLSSEDVLNWSDVEGSEIALSGAAGDAIWNFWGCYFRWVRLVYTRTSGTGSLTVASLQRKGE